MKKFKAVFFKSIIFFFSWAICVGLIPVPNSQNAAIWRFWAELIPFIIIVVVTTAFLLFDKMNIKLYIKPTMLNTTLGIIIGIFWLGLTVCVIDVFGGMQIDGFNHTTFLWLWFVSVFLNTIMQEMLIRGYLYQMIKKNYNMWVAMVVTTILFVLAHGGAFEAGVISVLNVVTMSLFMTSVLEYTNSLITPIMIHFIWNGIGAIILDGVSLAEDYPHLFNMTINSSSIMFGGEYKLEGSIIVLVLNIVLFVGFMLSQSKHKLRFNEIQKNISKMGL